METYFSSRFRDEEERECKSEQTEGRKEDICAPSYSFEHIRGDEADYATVEVRGSLERGHR